MSITYRETSKDHVISSSLESIYIGNSDCSVSYLYHISMEMRTDTKSTMSQFNRANTIFSA